jgi:hypothetical protein
MFQNCVPFISFPRHLHCFQAHRLLVPDGLLCVAFGSSCFPEKAIAAWLSRDMAQRAELVTRYAVIAATSASHETMRGVSVFMYTGSLAVLEL